jgi:hypothetical protein
MAETTAVNKIKLPPEMFQRLKDMEASIAESERGIEVMKRLGTDVSKLEEQITWAKEVRKTLLENFGD